MSNSIGKPLERVDGRLKVTGAARYVAEFPMENLAHAVVVRSTIARGRIQSIDTSAAKKSPGVLAVIPTSMRRDCKSSVGRLGHSR
jgi:xanthine dehydrogenase YagR molybdenum-binding subunit